MVPTGSAGGGHVPKSATHPIIRLLIPVFQGVQSEFGMGGESDPSRFLKHARTHRHTHAHTHTSTHTDATHRGISGGNIMNDMYYLE